MTSRIDYALRLAEQGFRVFPLSAGTKIPPKDFAWKAEATTNRAKIKSWWKADPAFNIGIAAGDGLVVLDVDVKGGKPGLESLALIESRGLADSFRVSTPSGGQHVYLRTSTLHQNSVDKLAEYRGVDVRSDGGYVVGPGSVVDGKTYTPIGHPSAVAAMPAWLDKLLVESAGKRKPKSEIPLVELDMPAHIEQAIRYLVDRAPEAIEGAGGDETTYRVATQCRDYGLSEGTVLELMLDHWNPTKATPPWDPAELEVKVQNAFTYATGGWGKDTALAEFGILDINVDVAVTEDTRRRLAEIAAENRKQRERAAAGNEQRPRLRILDYGAMLDMPEPVWLIPGLLLERRSALMFGQSNTFKSFLAIDMGQSIATGRRWHGFEVSKGRTLFVATEGAEGVGRARVPGWLNHYDVPESERFGSYLYPSEICLDRPADIEALITDMRAIGDFKLVVLDIFGGTMSGSEIEDTTARAWVHGIQRLMRETRASTLAVAHTGWQDKTRARMHTHFWGSFDTRMRVEGDKEKRTSILTIERHKDSDSTGKWGFRLEPSHGTLVPVMDQQLIRKVSADWSPQQKLALAALEAAIGELGEVRQGDGLPQQPVVTLAEWKEACLTAGLTASDDPASQKTVFNRVRRKLGDAGAIAEHADFVWSLD